MLLEVLQKSEKTVGNVHVQIHVRGEKLTITPALISLEEILDTLTPASMVLGAVRITQDSQKELQTADRME